MKFCVMVIPRNTNRFLFLPESNYKNIGKYSNSTIAIWKSSFFIIFIQNGIKRIRINLLMKREIHAAIRCGPLFLDLRGNRHPITWRRANLWMSHDKLKRLFRSMILLELSEIGRERDNLKLPNSLNTFSVRTSAEGKSWEQLYCCFVIQKVLFPQTKYPLILHFLALVIWCNFYQSEFL